MKIAFGSDIHLEFGGCVPLLPEGIDDSDIDVLILAGDISVHRSYSTADSEFLLKSADQGATDHFWRNVARRFKKVFYIPGNHEYYYSEYSQLIPTIQKYFEHYGWDKKITVSDRISELIEDVHFVGTTLWTDFNNADPMTLFSIKNMMSDFYLIQHKDEKFSPEDALYYHCVQRDFIAREVAGKDNVIVFTHHGPTYGSIHPKYKGNDFHTKMMNGAYVSNLENLILDNPQIIHWIHGHTHEDLDYFCGETNIITNPRGYFNAEIFDIDFKLKVIELT